MTGTLRDFRQSNQRKRCLIAAIDGPMLARKMPEYQKLLLLLALAPAAAGTDRPRSVVGLPKPS